MFYVGPICFLAYVYYMSKKSEEAKKRKKNMEIQLKAAKAAATVKRNAHSQMTAMFGMEIPDDYTERIKYVSVASKPLVVPFTSACTTSTVELLNAINQLRDALK